MIELYKVVHSEPIVMNGMTMGPRSNGLMHAWVTGASITSISGVISAYLGAPPC